MEYYKLLNLQREPFSNSPEPEFFYQSDQHMACLQKLELAIRLRRGLNVVIGEVGTGKTTLCRQIVLKFARREEDKDQIETHLLMDPSFSNVREFLATVALSLGAENQAGEESEWQIKESIKNYLFKRGIDEEKIVVLIIDEGQRLPSFCLEVLREFLNYETNEHKLLQIIIFAQKEFQPLLLAHANFADRINEYTFLRPLNFKNSWNLIKFRIGRAGASPAAVPALFSWPARWAIYRATGGYPRKIITLCHQVMLTTIIQNRVKAGYFLVRSCAARGVFAEKAGRPKWASTVAVAGFLFILLLIGYHQMEGLSAVWEKTVKKIWTPVRVGTFSATDGRQEKPAVLGELVLKTDGRALAMLEVIYGKDAGSQLVAFAKANPQIVHPEELKSGDVVKIPARLNPVPPLPPGKFWVAIASLNNLRDAYEFMRDMPEAEKFTLLSYWSRQEGITFTVLLKEGFDDEASARTSIKALAPVYRLIAHVVSGWGDKVFL